VTRNQAALPARQCQILAFQPTGVSVPRLETVVTLAKNLSIPLELCETEFVDTQILDSIAQKFGGPVRQSSVRSLLILGAFLEEQISFAAHHMLGVGFAVYLLRDMVLSKSPEHANIHDLRLVQAGVVPTTLQQVVYEWIVSESDEAVRAQLKIVTLH